MQDGARQELHGGEEKTTNNRMEILAVIKGLETLPESSEVTIFSDSQYVVSTMTRNWKRNANKDLWAKLDRLVGPRDVDFRWLKGHAGHPLQEEADRLAVEAAKLTVSGGAPLSGRERADPDDGPPSLTHLDEQGRARMVDISAKADTERVAVARGRVLMAPATLELVRSGQVGKGDVLGVARVAGVMAAKKTPDLIPLCHPLLLTDIRVEFELNEADSAVEITATVRTTGKTGVEMEAMTAVAVAALTIYDMAKAADRSMRIDAVRLARKSGGKSGEIVLE